MLDLYFLDPDPFAEPPAPEPEYDLHVGNALHVLPTLDRGLARTCITSPPYWGLRDYGDPGQEWPAVEFNLALGGVDVPVTVPAMAAPLGLEPTPIAYVAHLVAIFREVWHVLTGDGTLWLNIGDTYASDTKGQSTRTAGTASGLRRDGRPEKTRAAQAKGSVEKQCTSPRHIDHGMKSKDLCGIPWLLAYALRSDGWYLRSDVIWHKRNPMPESVTDRPTKGHEYLFLLAKSDRYFCDMGAIREPSKNPDQKGKAAQVRSGKKYAKSTAHKNSNYDHVGPARNKRTVWRSDDHALYALTEDERARLLEYIATPPAKPDPYLETLWTLTGSNFPGAHFAVIPPKLVEPCVLAGSEPDDTVLDPFAGSGTVGAIALGHDRRFVGVELSAEYAPLAHERIKGAIVARENERTADRLLADRGWIAGEDLDALSIKRKAYIDARALERDGWHKGARRTARYSYPCIASNQQDTSP